MLVCKHLTPDTDTHFAWFSGRSTEHFLVCTACNSRYPVVPDELVQADQDFLEAIDNPFSCEGIRGAPEVRIRPCDFQFCHEEYRSALPCHSEILDIVPVPDDAEAWYCLTQASSLYRVNIRRGQAIEHYNLGTLPFELDGEIVLCCSPQGDYAAIYQASGQLGVVFEIATGRVTLGLDRGDYRPENSHFPVAFFRHEGQTLLATATGWNRLEVVDPATGLIRTERSLTSDQALNYFHSQLLVSSDSTWIVDNGWVWHPAGIIRSWNLNEWVRHNPFESEDGPSVRELAVRTYYWDGPICWVNENTVAIWGWGSDDELLIPAIRLMDVVSGKELSWFAGPQVRKATCWPPKKIATSLFFDVYLASVSDEVGTAIWDIATGERLLHEASFVPTDYHPKSKDYLTVTKDGFRCSRLITSSE